MVFNVVYRPARQGRKVAYLTLASAGFLLLVLAVTRLAPTAHPSRNMSAENMSYLQPSEQSKTDWLEGVLP